MCSCQGGEFGQANTAGKPNKQAQKASKYRKHAPQRCLMIQHSMKESAAEA